MLCPRSGRQSVFLYFAKTVFQCSDNRPHFVPVGAAMLFLPTGVPSSIIGKDPKSLDMVLNRLVVGGLLAAVMGNSVVVVI